jgi:hypothetical protein
MLTNGLARAQHNTSLAPPSNAQHQHEGTFSQPIIIGTSPPFSQHEQKLQAELDALIAQVAHVKSQMAPSSARQRELLVAHTLGPREFKKLIHSRALGSQDSERSSDGPIFSFLPKSKYGHLLSDFVVDSLPASQADSHAPTSPTPSGGSASQSSYLPSQNSDALNVPNPNRHYNLRHIGVVNIRDEFLRTNSDVGCQRCGTSHSYIDEMCTHTCDIKGQPLPLLNEELCKHRILSKQLLGFPPERTQLDDEEYKEFLHFKTQKAAPPQAHQQQHSPTPSIHDDDDKLSRSSAHSFNSRQSSKASMAQVIATAISTSVAASPSALDIAVAVASAMGSSQSKVNNLLTNNPPTITNVEDSNYLMDTIWPAYQTYVHLAGDGPYRSLWDLYSPDQKQIMIDNFSEPITIQINATTIQTTIRNKAWFDNLSNDEFLDEMCKELGFQDVMATETSLKAIKFKGTVNQKQNWVNFKASWQLALKQMSSRSKLADKSLSTIFKNAIPDQFWRTNYEQHNHKTWLIGYAWCISKLQDVAFQNGFSRHTESLIKSAETKHNIEIDALKKKVAELEATSHKGTDSKRPDKAKPTPHTDSPATSTPAKAAWDTQRNVNPLWDPVNQRDDNKDRKPCSICNGIHKYKDELCTASKIKGTTTDTPRLSPAELQKRKWSRQQLGFYCSTLTNPPTEDASAPSSIESHHQKAAAVAKTVDAKPKK